MPRPHLSRHRRPLRAFATAFASLALLALAGTASAHVGEPPASASGKALPLDQVPQLVLPPIDAEALRKRDAQADKAGKPLQYAEPTDVVATPHVDGLWEELPGGDRLWRLRVHAPGATDLNFGFFEYALPKGATLHVLAESEDYYQGPYTAEDNRPHRELWTPVVPGDRAVIELFVPRDTGGDPELTLAKVGVGYLDMFHRDDATTPMSGACNNDVVCPEGNPWRNEIRSVANLSIDGSLACTGTMIRDVPGTFRSFMLTANHCGIDSGNQASVIAYWNYQVSTCGGARNGSLAQNQTGSTFRAAWWESDFALIELNAAPAPAYDVYWSGWDRCGAVPAAGTAIHHPNNDEKAISFDNDALTTSDSCIAFASNTHWRVGEYEDGTTEPGSSGCGIWNPAHLLVGTLSGGAASCSNIDYDCYGKFSLQWDGNGSPATRLRDWLDPAGAAPCTVAGADPDVPQLSITMPGFSSSDTCALGAGDRNDVWEPGETIDLTVALRANSPATGVRGTLTSGTLGVGIVDGSATWPNLPAATDTPSDPPGFRIVLSDTITCFSQVSLSLSVTANQGGPFVFPITGQVGESIPPLVPVDIPDNAGVAVSPLDVAESFTLTDVNVEVQIEHTWVGDLLVQLQSPAGTTVTLLDRPRFPATPAGCLDNDMEVTFDDAAPALPNLENHCLGDSPWYSGLARPVAPLSAFNGEPVFGTWRLLVSDRGPGDTGRIVDWSLITTPPLGGTCETCSAACPGQVMAVTGLRVAKGAADTVVLTYPGAPSACAQGVQVRMSTEVRPAVGIGSFPTDPAFADVTSDDLDAGPAFRHDPPAGNLFYLVVENLPGGAPGPSGHYGY